MVAGFSAVGFGALVVGSCSVSGVLTPQVDVGMRTAYVAPPVMLQPVHQPAPIQAAPVQIQPAPVQMQPAPVSLQTATLTIQPAPPPMQAANEPIRLERIEPAAPAAVMAVAYPRLTRPLATPGQAMPADEIACRDELRKLGVTYRNLPPINDGGSCRIDYPVEVSMLSGNIGMKPAAKLTCDMAAAFARWTRNELASAARWKYLSGVKTIHQGSSYSCRNIAGTRTASEHSKGRALDIMRIELENGRDIDVRKPGWFAFRKRSLLKSVRSGGCEYFTTVLGPGYDADHADHFHFDIKHRKNGYVACR